MDSKENIAIISKTSSVYKLEYVSKGKKAYITWEQKPEAVLETVFNGEGAVVQQKYAKMAGSDIEHEISSIIENNMIAKVENGQYENISISKPCPKCGAKALKRDADIHKENPVPVLPIYICGNCGAKSYYLTDEYLEYLVMGHMELFTKEELNELDKGRGAFMKELKEYIIRIFASKKIMCITEKD